MPTNRILRRIAPTVIASAICPLACASPATRVTARATPVAEVLMLAEGFGRTSTVLLGPSATTRNAVVRETVLLNTLTVPVKQLESFGGAGGYTTLASPTDGITGMKYGMSSMHQMLLPGRSEPTSLLCFKQEGGRWVGAGSEGKLYQDVDGKGVLIATQELKRYKSKTGEQQALMTKRTETRAKWCFEDQGSVYSLQEDGAPVQIGWVGWRVVTLANGTKLIVAMAKGMDAKAKWSGHHDGVLYVEK